MEMSIKINTFIEKQRFLYKCIFLIYAIFLATDFSRLRGFNSIKFLIMIWGISILLIDVIKSKGKLIKKNIILFIFSALGLISIFTNGSTFEDIKLYSITIIQIWVLNSVDKKSTFDNIKKEIKILNLIFIVITFLITFMGIIFIQYDFYYKGFLLVDPFGESLFKSFYIISTSAGLASYISICLTTIELLQIRKDVKKRLVFICFLIFNLVVQFYALIKSGARGPLVSFIVFIVTFLFILIKNKRVRNIIVSTIIILIVFFPIFKFNIENIKILNKNPNGNFFSGRLTLWEEGYNQVFKSKFLLGGAPDHYLDIIKDKSTETLIGLEGGRVHNIYLDVLYSNGLLGFLCLIGFICLRMIEVYKYSVNYLRNDNNGLYIKIIFAFLTSILILNLVESLLLYVINMISVLFWIYIGYERDLIVKNDI